MLLMNRTRRTTNRHRLLKPKQTYGNRVGLSQGSKALQVDIASENKKTVLFSAFLRPPLMFFGKMDHLHLISNNNIAVLDKNSSSVEQQQQQQQCSTTVVVLNNSSSVEQQQQQFSCPSRAAMRRRKRRHRQLLTLNLQVCSQCHRLRIRYVRKKR